MDRAELTDMGLLHRDSALNVQLGELEWTLTVWFFFFLVAETWTKGGPHGVNWKCLTSLGLM